MSFTAKLYNCSDDPRKLNKTLSEETNITGIVPTESCDILSPTFVLNYNEAYTTKNYIKVGAPFNRSYFITDMKIDIGKKIVISCAVDVLGTYKDEIEKLTVNITRQQDKSLKNKFLPDDKYVFGNQANVKTLEFKGNSPFSDDFTGRNYLLTIMGGNLGIIVRYELLTEKPADWDDGGWKNYYYQSTFNPDIYFNNTVTWFFTPLYVQDYFYRQIIE